MLYHSISDIEAILCTLSLYLPIVYTTFLLYIPPSSYYYRETTTYREVPSTERMIDSLIYSVGNEVFIYLVVDLPQTSTRTAASELLAARSSLL
jgi:hypothetical protein